MKKNKTKFPFQVAFLGVGNMGQALLAGALRSKFVAASKVTAYDVDAAKLKKFCAKSKIRSAKSAVLAAASAERIFLCVKPQQMREVLQSINAHLTAQQCLISIAAGVDTAFIERQVGSQVPVVRVMPNTPALLGQGMSALAGGQKAKAEHLKWAEKFFSSVGQTRIVAESALDAVTAVSGSGPAYVFFLTEILERGALALGLEAEAARQLSLATVQGAAAMLGGKLSAQELRAQVTSPKGTTEAALRHLENNRWAEIFGEALKAAAQRAAELRAQL